MGVGKGLCGGVLRGLCDRSTPPCPSVAGVSVSFYEVLGEEGEERAMLGKRTCKCILVQVYLVTGVETHNESSGIKRSY